MITELTPDDAYRVPAPKSLKDLLWLIIRELRAAYPVQGYGVTVSDAPGGNGRVINASGTGGKTAGTTPNDFSLYAAAGGKLGIDNGTLAGQLPDGMTEGATRGSEDAYTVTVSDSGYAYGIITVDTDTHAITSRSIGTGASVPDNTEDTGYVPLGDYSVTDGVLSIGSGKQGVGSQAYLYDRWRDWFSNPATYSYAHQFGPA